MRARQAALDLADAPTAASVLAVHEALLGDVEPRWCWPHWHTPSSRPSTRCPTATGTGRALVHALLRHHGVTRSVTVPMPVSAGLLSDVDGYVDALTAYRAGDPDPIVTASTRGTLAAVINATQLVEELSAVRAAWSDTVRARSDAAAWRVADLLLRQPVLDSVTVARELAIPPQNAIRVLQPLVEAGVVSESTGRKRHRRWPAGDVLAALDAFAARSGGRARPGG